MKKIPNLLLKLSWAFFIFLCTNKESLAQEEFKRQKSFAAGYGFITTAKFNGIEWKDMPEYKYSSLGPFYVKYANRVSESISWGINLAFAQYNYSFVDSFYVFTGFSGGNPNGAFVRKRFGVKYDTYSVLGRINFHFLESEKLKPFAGFGIGYRIGVYTYSDPDKIYYKNTKLVFNANELRALFPLGIEATAGSRFYIKNKLAVYVELGIAKSVLQFGVVQNL